MKVPLLDLKAQHDPIQQELLEAIAQVIQSQAFILGPDVPKLEEARDSIPQGTRINVTFLGNENLAMRLEASRAVIR